MDRCKSYIDYKLKTIAGIESIRKRPGMYIGSTTSRGLHHLIEELLLFALSHNSKNIEVILHPNNIISFSDRNYNISTDIDAKTDKSFLEIILTNLNNKPPTNIYEIYSHGMVVVNALSEWLEVTVWHDDIIYDQRYERGKAVTKLQEQPNNNNRMGTSITFKPDRDIFNEDDLNITILKMRLQQLAYSVLHN